MPGQSEGQTQGADHDAAMRSEKLSALPPIRMSPDQICGLVAEEPEVREAAARWDGATPSTHHGDLVAARLAAQARIGISEAERAPLCSGEVEDFPVPVMIRMGRGEEGAVVVELRKELTRLYGEFSETVLLFMLKTYRHHSTEALLRAARSTAP